MSFVCEYCEKSFEVKRYLKNHIIKVHASAKLECNICQKFLSSKGSLNSHIIRMHPKSESSKILMAKVSGEASPVVVKTEIKEESQDGLSQTYGDKLVCKVCAKSFSYRSSLTTHLRELHKVVPPKRETCHCPQCGIPCFTTKAVIEHLDTEHFIKIVEQEIIFASYDEFIEWKFKTERDTVSFYILERKEITQANYVHFFPCNRSGYHKVNEKGGTCLAEKQKRKIEKDSKKINAICPASMTAYQSRLNGETVVKYIVTHVGHRLEASRLPISLADREFIRESYRNNLTTTAILEECRSLPINNPLRYISRGNILRIGKSSN